MTGPDADTEYVYVLSIVIATAYFCTHRIVITKDLETNLKTDSFGPYNFTKELDISKELSVTVSDHYPVEMELEFPEVCSEEALPPSAYQRPHREGEGEGEGDGDGNGDGDHADEL